MQNKYESFRSRALWLNTNHFLGNDSLRYVEVSFFLNCSFTKEQTGFKVLRANGLRLA